MKSKLLFAGLVALAASLSGCVVAPAYDGPGYYGGGAVVVAPAPVYYGGYGYYGYRGGYYGSRGGYYRRGPYRHR
jgi:hypothetical protein